MSEVWRLDRAGLAAASSAAPVRGADIAFVPLAARLLRSETPAAVSPMREPAAPTEVDLAMAEAAAWERGVAEGLRQSGDLLADERAALVEEREALRRLAQTLVALSPQPSGDLALLLAATVERLVRQVVGEVAIDGLTLLARAKAAAALIADEAVPGRMRLHPQDAARLAEADLPVELVADATLSPGSVLLETRDGWIEHGVDVALDRLDAVLDGLGVAR
ncbi:flagellar assembly protein FliH [Sphingomonas jatrophae]|uniref:Flagellar assembly protein FliH n=1 Tax=Sphingomonas jatrophae TaxID=1166337 RepID=A0A1I6MBE1_9SPHN|nr:hypothetical protein [Sphingomonas jatrophae]SFS12908.1 flagellar assembly protein FliH [Sphingomonas jatrophae]